MDRAVDAANLGVSAAGDLSVWALFMHASLVVKIVMLGLLICSVMVWAIILDKFVTLRRINREATGFEDRFWSGGSLDDLYESDGAKPTNRCLPYLVQPWGNGGVQPYSRCGSGAWRR